jgi:hypothetical protein
VRNLTLAAVAAAILATTACSSDDTPAGSNQPDESAAVDSPELCGHLEDLRSVELQKSSVDDGFWGSYVEPEDPTDLATVAALRQWGADSVDLDEQGLAILRDAASSTSDPDIQDAIAARQAYYEVIYLAYDQAASNAVDTVSFAADGVGFDNDIASADIEADHFLEDWEMANCSG